MTMAAEVQKGFIDVRDMGVTFGANTSQRAGWRRTWLHRWLVPNAERYGFRPLATEEWHWDYRASSGS